MELNQDVNLYSKVQRLSDEDVSNLWDEYFKSKEKELRDKLIIQYLYLIRYVISRIKLTLPPAYNYEDIMSFGTEGLIDAIEKYTNNKGAKFETYAIMRIRGAIIDKIRAQDWLPRSVRRKIKELKTIIEDFKQEKGRTPTNAELSEITGIKAEKIDEILSSDMGFESLYATKKVGDGNIEIIDTIEDDKHTRPDEEAEKKDSKRELERALKKLPERERTLLILYYHENMTLKQIGDAINVSESRVCQLHAQAIMKLRNILSTKRSERLNKSIV
ncbi:MAG: FliA/WhiG family RNA polymerase sigma factor [Cyanobacteria bacterium SIG30]|nr:FliA/WhiG family RNA polymerase sigma factor [Cyanobacteria bacterium SIG30]